MAVIPVPANTEDLRPILEMFDTVVMMKVAKKLDEIIQLLEEMNLLENALFASYIGQKRRLPHRRYLTSERHGQRLYVCFNRKAGKERG